MKVQRVTPLLIVDEIPPALTLWKEALQYEIVVQVQEDPSAAEGQGPLGFVLLENDGQHVMLQTRASLEKDLPAVLSTGVTTCLYLDVSSLDEAMRAMPTTHTGATLIVPERTTFYGAREAAYRLSSGHVMILSEHTSSNPTPA